MAARFLELAEEAGIPTEIVQGVRTMEEQRRLYEQGRSAPGRIVTHAEPGDSYHNYGLAFDVVPTAYKSLPDWNPEGPAWETLGRIGESLGLEWGGRWRSKDLPHFQIPSGLAPLPELKDYWEKFKRVMPITITPTMGGAAMIVLVLLAGYLFYRWAGDML